VAQHAHIWHSFADTDSYPDKSEILARHCADVGRDPAEIRKQIVIRADIAAGQTSEQLTEALLPFMALGVEDFLVSARPPADFATIDGFAREVGPAVRAA
jgi:hypothetical protein